MNHHQNEYPEESGKDLERREELRRQAYATNLRIERHRLRERLDQIDSELASLQKPR